MLRIILLLFPFCILSIISCASERYVSTEPYPLSSWEQEKELQREGKNPSWKPSWTPKPKSEPIRTVQASSENANQGIDTSSDRTKQSKQKLDKSDTSIASQNNTSSNERGLSASTSSDVDVNIPQSRNENRNAIAVVIGNSNYRKAKIVDYSLNDALTVKKYLINTFGYKEDNIFFIQNASKADFEVFFGNDKSYQGKLYNAVKEGKSDVFIYYSGHGAPGLKDKKGYFVPVEADPQYLELSGYPADVFYQNLSKIPARSITVVLDACFSGATIFDNISPIVIQIDNPIINLKNGVVLSSSSGSQVSSWYNEKRHGMFTYFFLKAIQEKAGNASINKLTYEDVYKYVADKTEGVPYYARRIHGVEQNPTLEGHYQGKTLLTY